MDLALSMLLSWQFILFCLGIAALTYVIRLIVEYVLGQLNKLKSKLWNELLLPIGPVVSGPVIAWYFESYPYPSDLKQIGGRVVFGLVAGLFSGLVYKIVKGLVSDKYKAVSEKAEDLSLDKVASQLRDTIVK